MKHLMRSAKTLHKSKIERVEKTRMFMLVGQVTVKQYHCWPRGSELCSITRKTLELYVLK